MVDIQLCRLVLASVSWYTVKTSVYRQNNEARTHIALFRRFTDTNGYGTGPVKMLKTCRKMFVDIRICFTVYALNQCVVMCSGSGPGRRRLRETGREEQSFGPSRRPAVISLIFHWSRSLCIVNISVLTILVGLQSRFWTTLFPVPVTWLVQNRLYKSTYAVVINSPRDGCEVLGVCLSACLTIRSHNWKTLRSNFTKFLCMLPVAVARSSSYGVVIRYVLPVLWMTLFSHNGHMARRGYSFVAIEHDNRDSGQILLNDRERKYLLWVRTGGEVCYLQWCSCYRRSNRDNCL